MTNNKLLININRPLCNIIMSSNYVLMSNLQSEKLIKSSLQTQLCLDPWYPPPRKYVAPGVSTTSTTMHSPTFKLHDESRKQCMYTDGSSALPVLWFPRLQYFPTPGITKGNWMILNWGKTSAHIIEPQWRTRKVFPNWWASLWVHLHIIYCLTAPAAVTLVYTH